MNTFNHQVSVFSTEAHGGLELEHTLPGAVCTDTDPILLLQSKVRKILRVNVETRFLQAIGSLILINHSHKIGYIDLQ